MVTPCLCDDEIVLSVIQLAGDQIELMKFEIILLSNEVLHISYITNIFPFLNESSSAPNDRVVLTNCVCNNDVHNRIK